MKVTVHATPVPSADAEAALDQLLFGLLVDAVQRELEESLKLAINIGGSAVLSIALKQVWWFAAFGRQETLGPSRGLP